MALQPPFDPPSYQESLTCQILKSKKSFAAILPPTAEQCVHPDGDSLHHGASAAGQDGLVCVTVGEDALERVRGATEDNAADFIWVELPKHLKMQWTQRDLRAALDECPRYALPTGGNRFVKLYVDIAKGKLSLQDWQRERADLMDFMVGGAGKQKSDDQSARDRIGSVNEENAAHFIWFELPKELKAEWDMRLIRSVLDDCPRYSPATSGTGNRFVNLYDHVKFLLARQILQASPILTQNRQILSGTLSSAMWQQEHAVILDLLRFEEMELTAESDRALAHSLHADWNQDAGIVRQKCKAPGCNYNHARHFCQTCKMNDSDHRTGVCPNAPAGPSAVVTLPVHPVGGSAVPAAFAPAAQSGTLLHGPPNEMTLYHQTCPAFGQKIVQEQMFLCSDPSKGRLLAGPGIYFAVSPSDTTHKVRNPANLGCILAADVSLGNVLEIGEHGDRTITLENLRARGYDSVRVPRNGNPGTEYVVYHTSQIKNIRIYQ